MTIRFCSSSQISGHDIVCYICGMNRYFLRAAAAVVCTLPLLAACSDKRADAGLIGSDKVTTITQSGPASLEPVFFSQITIDQSGRAALSMQNTQGPLSTKKVELPSGSFESIALDLADFRRATGHARSECRGHSDAGPVTVSWRYTSGRVGSYSVQPGCQQPYEQRFLQVATSLGSRVGLQSSMDRAPKPQP